MYCTIKGGLYSYDDITKYFGNERLKSCKFWQRDTYIGFNFSLAKFYFGNNFETLTIDKTKEAINELSDILHLDFNNAEITRVDFATNLILNEPPYNYYCHLVELPRRNRNIVNKLSLYFSSKTRTFVFYDKTVDAKKRNMTVPDYYKNKNVGRFETRWLQLRKYFRAIEAEKLYEPLFFNCFLREWKKDYSNIIKLPAAQLKKEIEMFGMKEITDFGLHQFIKQFPDFNSFIDFLNREYKRDKMSRQTMYNIKKKALGCYQNSDLFEMDKSLIEELNLKVEEAYKEYAA